MWVCSVGAVYNKMGENEKALEYYDKSLEIKIKVLGQDHLLVAATKMNIGSVLYGQGKFPEAMQMYEQSAEAQERQLGEHLDTALSMIGVALVLNQMGKLDEALAKYSEVLRIQQKVLGCEHLLVADTKHKCAR